MIHKVEQDWGVCTTVNFFRNIMGNVHTGHECHEECGPLVAFIGQDVLSKCRPSQILKGVLAMKLSGVLIAEELLLEEAGNAFLASLNSSEGSQSFDAEALLPKGAETLSPEGVFRTCLHLYVLQDKVDFMKTYAEEMTRVV
jgi:hypothetical protein